ncbi:MAG: hypothetical protein E6G94_14325 [Alphaproteobacteria bacterium]|nr:MAG: hypothetical protein E6G94_14325 [Alphaproteobacteria bacterium]
MKQYDGRTVFLPRVGLIRSGDILLTFNAESRDRAGSKTSRLITAATRGRFSHALICSSPPTFVEAISAGVSTLSLARCFAHDLRNVRLLRYPDASVAAEAARLVQLEIGRDYSRARAVSAVFPVRTLSRIEDHGIFCSALVAQAYVTAGGTLFGRTPVERTTPATIDELEGLDDLTEAVFSPGPAPRNIETMSALDGDRAPTLSERQTELSNSYAKALWPVASGIADDFPELERSVTPSFYGLLDFVVNALLDTGELTGLLREIAAADDAMLSATVARSFHGDPDIDVVALRGYLEAGREQLSQRQESIRAWEEWGLEHSVAMRAYLPIDRNAAEAIRRRNTLLEEILGRLGG